jgi:hypothetical protein
MADVNYNGRTFRGAQNTPNGEVDEETRFFYRQKDDLVWAEYSGPGIRLGQLIGIADADGTLDLRYQHVNASDELMTGVCRTTPELLPDGRLRLHEKWRWTCGEMTDGASVVEEITPAPGAEKV